MESPGRDSPVWKTALYEQYWRLKDSVPGCLMFFRLGDFYELFGQDALDAAPLMEVQLTSRDKSSALPVPMCGVPAHAVDSYAEKLLHKGFKVALAEQLTAAGEKKMIERGIVRILTPGLPVDFGRLDARSPHWFLAFGFGPLKKIEAMAYDFLGGELYEGTVENADALADLLARLNPREILVPAAWLTTKSVLETWPVFQESSTWHSRLTPWAGEKARENLEAYLLYTQRCDRESLKALLPDPRDLATLTGGGAGSEWARLPSNVFEHWAVFPELMDLLDGCGSAVGTRRLRQWIASPLRSVPRIQRRQKAFATLRDPAKILAASKEVYDFERILGRFRVGAAAPRELLRFLQSFRAAEAALGISPVNTPEWKAFTNDENLGELADLRGSLRPLLDKLGSALEDNVDPARLNELTALIRAGFDADFDALKNAQTDMETWLASYEESLRSSTSIPSLKVRYNRVFGHYIEVTKTHLDKVPSNFERKQTTVGGERFTTLELRGKETEILSAGTRAERKAREILEALQSEILARDADLRAFIAHFAWVDAVAGAAQNIRKLQRFGPWIEPQVVEGDFHFTIREARHPVIENITGNFVPNSIELGGGPHAKRLLVLTGPNMAGKSTLMRQTGICLLLGQCGLAVPAAGMSFAPCSGFYSRMGATDRILAGESTFMVEMKESAAILRSADAQSFILLDEIGRGTSTQDGLAIAHAVLEHIHNDLGAICLFATHYHELSDAALLLERAVNGSMGIREWKGDLVFLRTLVLEPAESSHGIFVARMAGLPKKLLTRAQQFFNQLHEQAAISGKAPQLTLDFGAPSVPTAQVPEAKAKELSEEERAMLENARKIFDELKCLDPNELSPKQAWLALEGLREMVSERT